MVTLPYKREFSNNTPIRAKQRKRNALKNSNVGLFPKMSFLEDVGEMIVEKLRIRSGLWPNSYQFCTLGLEIKSFLNTWRSQTFICSDYGIEKFVLLWNKYDGFINLQIKYLLNKGIQMRFCSCIEFAQGEIIVVVIGSLNGRRCLLNEKRQSFIMMMMMMSKGSKPPQNPNDVLPV